MQSVPTSHRDLTGREAVPMRHRALHSAFLILWTVISLMALGCRSDGTARIPFARSTPNPAHSEPEPGLSIENSDADLETIAETESEETDEAGETLSDPFASDNLQTVAHTDEQTDPDSSLSPLDSQTPDPMASEPSTSETMTEEVIEFDSLPPQQITLAAVLETIDRDNPTVNFTRYRINEAYAQWQRARVLWLPSLRAGLNYNKHEGRIQDVVGSNIDTSRGAFYTGLGAGAVGAASPAVPGIYANFHLTDAIFQPKIAAWVNTARHANSRAVTNDLLLQASQAYWELLRAEQERAVAREILSLTGNLADLTESYAETGQGLASDADRVRTERFLRQNDLTRAEESVMVASARLAQLLSGDPTIPLQPLEPTIVPVELVSHQTPIHDLVAQGLVNRPEIEESHALICEAVQRLERERKAPLIPSLLLGVSYGGFGAGLGGNIDGFADRLDGDAVAYWEIRNLGLGERAARGEAGSRVDQSRMRQIAQMDLVAREIVETHAQVRARRKQIAVAREAITVAHASYDKNIERITNAQGLPLEALQSIQALSQSQREYLRALVDYNQGQFALHRALGWPAAIEIEY